MTRMAAPDWLLAAETVGAEALQKVEDMREQAEYAHYQAAVASLALFEARRKEDEASRREAEAPHPTE